MNNIIENIKNLKESMDTDKVKLDSIVVHVETATELMFNEYPNTDEWDESDYDDAQYIDMYRIYVEPTTEGFNVEVYPWSWGQCTILTDEPLKFTLDSEGLIKLLDPASIQDMLLNSYPRLFKIEE